MACVDRRIAPACCRVICRLLATSLLLANASAAQAQCEQTGVRPLCVEMPASLDPQAGRLVTQLVRDRSCSTEVAPAKAGEAHLLTAQVSEPELASILVELNRRRVSYAYAIVPNKRWQNACAYKLVPLRSALIDEATIYTSKKTQSAPAAQPTTNKTLPAMRYDYLTKDDAMPDFERLKDSFASLGDAEKREALGIMRDLYNEWGLREAQAFIGEVAHGSLQYRVNSSVRAQALKLASSIDSD
ncbi:hypothetical protein [Thiosocius teredinicola]|uniref:hypothetical protein n=1 Tax=Thiosocius teredinicola TaxID=1973002 RepID=UPI000F7AB79D